jgi:Tol biopolymer transport system component
MEVGDQEHELYSVPVAGPSSAGVKLNKTLVAGGQVWSWWISPDSSRVVYQAEQDTDEVWEVYSVPLAGPASEGVKLNKTLVAGGGLAGLTISPDSSRVVYRADQEVDQAFELYSVPLAGPASEGVKLNGALVIGGWVEHGYVVSPDNNRVVYRADQDTDQMTELYSVPLNGPASAGLKLNGALPAGGDVAFGFDISPDSSYVVYRADQDSDGVMELYSVPLAGPASAGAKVNGPLTTGGNVSNFEVSPDSASIVYLADQDTDDVAELYAADPGLERQHVIYLPLVVRGDSSLRE